MGECNTIVSAYTIVLYSPIDLLVKRRNFELLSFSSYAFLSHKKKSLKYTSFSFNRHFNNSLQISCHFHHEIIMDRLISLLMGGLSLILLSAIMDFFFFGRSKEQDQHALDV